MTPRDANFGVPVTAFIHTLKKFSLAGFLLQRYWTASVTRMQKEWTQINQQLTSLKNLCCINVFQKTSKLKKN